MRTLVDIGEQEVLALDEISRSEARSRAALIRQAIDEYLARHLRKKTQDAFGLWGRKEDGLAFQNRLRDEW